MKSKKLISIIISLCMVMTGIMCCLGCDGEKPYVDTSNAAVPGQFDNPETAKAKEAEDDAAGREHIEIPKGAETIEIDGEIYYPIDSLEIDFGKYGDDAWSKNYILTGDVDITGDTACIGYIRNIYNADSNDIPFRGKFNGNNYKIYGKRNRLIFNFIIGAEISNFVLSSELVTDGDNENAEVLFCAQAFDSTIKNIVNYSCLDNGNGFVYYSYNCNIDNIVNYGDGKNMSGTIIRGMRESTVRNCKNYGNFSQINSGVKCFGAIIGIIWHFGTAKSTVEYCENYGNLIGNEYVGGILGRVIYYTNTIGNEQKENPSTINNCKNFGDIYKDKNYSYTVLGTKVDKFSHIGGIAGNGAKIENCTNQGHIYGFESISPEYTAMYIGGIAGSAISVVGCKNHHDLVLDTAVEYGNNICGYYITFFY